MRSIQIGARLEQHSIRRLTFWLAVGAVGLVLAGCGSSGSSSTFSPSGTGPVFANSTAITNRYLPLASLNQAILEGTEGSETVRVEVARKPGTRSFTVNGQTIAALILEEREFVDGELAEVSLNYIAQSDDGTVYYLGEDVDDYEDGQVVGHGGAWLYGVNTQTLGVLMPGQPKIGDRFQPENVPGITVENAEVVSVSETVTVPAGTYTNCLKIQETHPEGEIEFKYYAPGVGLIKEEPEDGEVTLRSRQ
jgi:hypothetical protein